MKFIRQEQGFTMIEALLSTLCAALFCMILSQSVLIMMKGIHYDFAAEDMLAIKQLQLMLAQADDFSIHDDKLYFTYHQDSFYLTQYQNSLVKRKGFEVILQDVDHVAFYNDKGCYHMRYQRNHTERKAVLVCEK